MALSAAQRLVLVAPQFAGNVNIPLYIELAEELTAPASACGMSEVRRTQAIALRAAHMMTLALDPSYAGGATGGAVSSKREGDLSLSYGTSSAADKDADLSQTVYGRQLMELAASTFLLVGVTGGSCCG